MERFICDHDCACDGALCIFIVFDPKPLTGPLAFGPLHLHAWALTGSAFSKCAATRALVNYLIYLNIQN